MEVNTIDIFHWWEIMVVKWQNWDHFKTKNKCTVVGRYILLYSHGFHITYIIIVSGLELRNTCYSHLCYMEKIFVYAIRKFNYIPGQYLYTMINLFWKNGFLRAILYQKWSLRCEIQWEVHLDQNISTI